MFESIRGRDDLKEILKKVLKGENLTFQKEFTDALDLELTGNADMKLFEFKVEEKEVESYIKLITNSKKR